MPSESQMETNADRTVRQRVDDASATSTGTAATSSLIEPSPFTHALRPSLMRLAVVERQLIMQLLDFKSLARVSRTSRQLLQESLHPQAGCFIPELDGLQSTVSYLTMEAPPGLSSRQTIRRSCRLFQMHVVCTLSAIVDKRLSHTHQAEALNTLLEDAARCRKVRSLDLPGTGHDRFAAGFQYPEEFAMQILSSPVVQSVRAVKLPHGDPHVWTRTAVIRRAICQLPALTSIELSSTAVERLTDDLALATGVRHCVCQVMSRDLRQLQPLCKMNLVNLTLSGMHGGPPHVQALALPSLTSLAIRNANQISHAQSRALFSQIHALRELVVSNCSSVDSLLLGAGDIGVAGLPALRRCVILGEEPPETRSVRRFIHRCPQVTSFVFDLSEDDDDGEGLTILRKFGAWGPPVEVNIGAYQKRPAPSADDDLVFAQPSNL